MKKIEEYIVTHLNKPIRLSTLAGLASCSVFHFTRRFKTTCDHSPYQFVLLKKMQEARRLLKVRGNSVADVAYKMGFSSPSYFNTFFKKHAGFSPSKLSN